MKKIVAAFDGLRYSKSTENYAIHLAKQTGACLVGVFMDDFLYTSYKIYDLVINEGLSEKKLKTYEAKDKLTRHNAAKKFDELCRKAGLEYTIHHDKSFAIQEIKHESIYSDLLIIDSNETLSHYSEKLPTRFIRDLLGDAQCPVLVVPKNYIPIQKVILLYDGEPSSVYAMKMFSYLLPQLRSLDTEVVSVNPLEANYQLADDKLIKEYIKQRFPKVKYTVLKGQAENRIIKYLDQQQKNSLIVLGAYKRNTLSRWFRESMADILMKKVKLPLFIAHNK